MKNLVVSFFLIISVIGCNSLMRSQSCDVISNFSDSITDLINNKEILYYTRGNYGHVWSLALSEKGHYIVVSGNTRNNDYRIDTISIHEPVLKWGLDTMELYCQKMMPVPRSYYWPFHTRLILLSDKKEIIFDCTDTDTYSGTDSVTFNKKLNELKYLMYWLASPIENQKKLPNPL